MLKLLENCYSISISDANYNWQVENFKKAGLPPPIKFVGADSCEQSHMNIIQMAKDKNLPYITIFEDDAQPSINALQELNVIESKLDEIWNAVGIVTLGYNWLGFDAGTDIKEDCIFDYFFTNRYTAAGSHALFIKKEAYDDRLKSLKTSVKCYGSDYMKENDYPYNWADRYAQDHFKLLALIVQKKIFAQYNLEYKVDYNLDNDPRFLHYLTYNDEVLVRDTISVEDLMSHSFVISLSNKRIKVFNKIFEKSNLLPLPKVWKGFDFSFDLPEGSQLRKEISKITPYSLKSIGCSAAHSSLIRLAKYLDWPFVCIFEDDAYPCKDIHNKLKEVLKIIPKNCKALMLGNNWFNGRLYNKDLYIITSNEPYGAFAGAHAYVIFKEGYDDYLKISLTKDWIADQTPIMLRDTFSPYYNLFIQYNYKDPSMTVNHAGYIWGDRSKESILQEFPAFEEYGIDD